jgi:hypothetical protein
MAFDKRDRSGERAVEPTGRRRDDGGRLEESAVKRAERSEIGNQVVQRFVRRGPAERCVGSRDDAAEHQASEVERSQSTTVPLRVPTTHAPTLHSSADEPVSKATGLPLAPEMRHGMERRVGSRLPIVRLHTGPEAAEAARRLDARAFTAGHDIYFGPGEYQPGTGSGDSLLAHELVHTLQNDGLIRRRPASEVIGDYQTSYGPFTSLDEEGLGRYLAGRLRAGAWNGIIEVIDALGWSDRDDVAGEVMAGLTVVEVIAIARTAEGQAVLRRLADELGSGYETYGEHDVVTFIKAVLEPTGFLALLWNQKRIEELKKTSGSDLEALAALFDDDRIVDDGTVAGRLTVILRATEHLVIPGLQTGIDFGDTGFRGEQTPTCSGFRDPHPSSQNQVGHFLTAVGLVFAPEVVSRPIPGAGSIRDLIEAPASMTDDEVALRLTIGHEKAPDPLGAGGMIGHQLGVWLGERYLTPAPEGETEEQRDERVSRAMAEQLGADLRGIFAAFRAQFRATTHADIAAWNEALDVLRNTGSTETPGNPLERISVDPTLKGNSRQDLRLSVVGWQLGRMIRAEEFASRAQVAEWIRQHLAASPEPPQQQPQQ